MFFLIDGYNLLYALGLLQRRAGPHVLENARLRLLGFLRDGHGDDSHRVTVVFDAKHAPAYAAAEQEFQGIHVLFALAQEQADDLIEEMIRKASVPKKLTVVSDDRRIRTAAQRRHCLAWTCGEYQDHLDRIRQKGLQPPSVAAPEGGKPEKLTQEETQRWLDEFGGLEGLTD
jgi:predicted RNA-binding protein with PIN domain